MQKIKVLYGPLLLLILSACAEEIKKDERPNWIDNPEPDYVGKCATHVMGLIA